MMSEAERDAILEEAKVEAREQGLEGDAFWVYCFKRVEAAMIGPPQFDPPKRATA